MPPDSAERPGQLSPKRLAKPHTYVRRFRLSLCENWLSSCLSLAALPVLSSRARTPLWIAAVMVILQIVYGEAVTYSSSSELNQLLSIPIKAPEARSPGRSRRLRSPMGGVQRRSSKGTCVAHHTPRAGLPDEGQPLGWRRGPILHLIFWRKVVRPAPKCRSGRATELDLRFQEPEPHFARSQ